MSKAEQDLTEHSAAYTAFASALAHFHEVLANDGGDEAASAALDTLDEAAFAVLRAPYRTPQALAEKANVVELLQIEGDDLGSRAARELAAAILRMPGATAPST